MIHYKVISGLFLLNIFTTIYLFNDISEKSVHANFASLIGSIITNKGFMNFNNYYKYVKIAALVSLLFTSIHAMFCMTAPGIYLKIQVYLCLFTTLITLICSIYLLFTEDNKFYSVLSILGCIGNYFYYRYLKSLTKNLGNTLQKSVKLIIKNSSVLLIVVMQTIFVYAIALCYALSSLLAFSIKESRYVYIYFIFSYIWIYTTSKYVLETTTVGLIQNDRKENSIPAFKSYFDSITYKLGSNALAGLILSSLYLIKILTVLKSDDDKDKDDDKKEKKNDFLKSIFDFIYSQLHKIIKYFNHYGLIYVGLYDMKFLDGCHKVVSESWFSLYERSTKKSLITNSINFYSFLFTLAAFLFTFCLQKDTTITTKILTVILTCTFQSLFFSSVSLVSEAYLIESIKGKM